MTTDTTPPIHHELELLGQTVVVIGGSAGIGFATARRARAEGAEVVITGRNADRFEPRRGRTRRPEHGHLRRHRSRSTREVVPGSADPGRPCPGHRWAALLLPYYPPLAGQQIVG